MILDFKNMFLSDAKCHLISENLPNLEILTFLCISESIGCTSDIGLEYLGNLKKLKKLSLLRDWDSTNTAITSIGISALNANLKENLSSWM